MDSDGNPYTIVRHFEEAVARYTGAPYCVAVDSCTSALFLCLLYHKKFPPLHYPLSPPAICLPRRTYVSVPMMVLHAGYRLEWWRGEGHGWEWKGLYQLSPLRVYDCAKRFTSGMYDGPGLFMCLSFGRNKILSIGRGGAILHDNPEADVWFRKARYDGRTEGVDPKEDTFTMLGWHMYMTPQQAAEGLSRLACLPKHNEDLPCDEYPDLRTLEIFQ